MIAAAHADTAIAEVAAAIGEPARARMLFSLMDGRARTSTELSALAGVSASTASVHLARLTARALVTVVAQGKHRYYALAAPHVAPALEALSVLAGAGRAPFVPTAPARLRAARTCYDHLAGSLGVALHDRLLALGWLRRGADAAAPYDITASGTTGMGALGIDVDEAQARRRRFAAPCLDWSERRPHLGGSLAAAILTRALDQRWLTRDPDSRALTLTTAGRREWRARIGLQFDA